MKIRKFAYGLLATLALGTCTGGGAEVVHAQDDQAIRIGANLELSGYGSAYGIPILDNLRLLNMITPRIKLKPLQLRHVYPEKISRLLLAQQHLI